jgi:hypothetical protein
LHAPAPRSRVPARSSHSNARNRRMRARP